MPEPEVDKLIAMPEPEVDKPRFRPTLPPREYIYRIMMARSHEIIEHEGNRCDCDD